MLFGTLSSETMVISEKAMLSDDSVACMVGSWVNRPFLSSVTASVASTLLLRELSLEPLEAPSMEPASAVCTRSY